MAMARLRMVSAARSNMTATSMTASMTKLRSARDGDAGKDHRAAMERVAASAAGRNLLDRPTRRKSGNERHGDAQRPHHGRGDQRHVQAGNRDDMGEMPVRRIDSFISSGCRHARRRSALRQSRPPAPPMLSADMVGDGFGAPSSIDEERRAVNGASSETTNLRTAEEKATGTDTGEIAVKGEVVSCPARPGQSEAGASHSRLPPSLRSSQRQSCVPIP